MAEEIDFENGRNSNFKELVTLTLTFDWAKRHTVVHHSSTSTYIPNFIQIEETFCGRTDVRTDGRTDISPLYIIRSTLGSRPNNYNITSLMTQLGTWQSTTYCLADGRSSDAERRAGEQCSFELHVLPWCAGGVAGLNTPSHTHTGC